MLHVDLERVLGDIDAAEREARSLVFGLSDAQANWQAQAGTTWSLAQCLDHLARVDQQYADCFLAAVDGARLRRGSGPFKGLALGWLGRRFVASLEPPPSFRAKAPSRTVPVSRAALADTLDSYARAHDAFRRLILASTDVDPNRLVTRNPFFPMVRMRLSTALLAVPAHERRHIWQMRRVRSAPDFPDAATEASHVEDGATTGREAHP
ncbi:MAG: DinB family protein [Vicinamibacterales bacterium]